MLRSQTGRVLLSVKWSSDWLWRNIYGRKFSLPIPRPAVSESGRSSRLMPPVTVPAWKQIRYFPQAEKEFAASRKRFVPIDEGEIVLKFNEFSVTKWMDVGCDIRDQITDQSSEAGCARSSIIISKHMLAAPLCYLWRHFCWSADQMEASARYLSLTIPLSRKCPSSDMAPCSGCWCRRHLHKPGSHG